jgi:hypothetical protein
MINGISNVSPSEPADQSAAGTSNRKPAKLESQAGTGGDSVQLSKAAQATLATLQETTETNAQTVKEAAHGDLQAKRLLAKEAAEKANLK